MTKLPILDFHCHGNVTQDELQDIRGILEECYPRLGRWLPDIVEIRLFDTSGKLTAFLNEEKKELGITSSGDEASICSHDAWRGYSRLSICLERLNSLPLLARLGALRHEAAHTVLHGGLAYYIVRIPADCLELARARGMHLALLQQVLYHCSIAVKDFEVTRLLLRAGYHACQIAFVESEFRPSEEDRLAWHLASSNAHTRLIFICGQLKTLLLGLPLEMAGLKRLEAWTNSMLSYIDMNERQDCLIFARRLSKQMGDITHDNIRLVLRQVLQKPLGQDDRHLK